MSDGTQTTGPKKHPPLIVWCADMQAGNSVLEALQQGFAPDLRTSLPEVDEDISGETPDMLLLCLSPVETLCRTMEEGAVPSVALKRWQDQAQDIIALSRRNRRKVRILDIDMATSYPAAFLRWFGLPEDEAQIAALSREEAPDRDEILNLLALRTLSNDMPARVLQGELEAVSLNLAEGAVADAADPDAAYLLYRDIREQQTHLQAQNRAVQEEAAAQGDHKAQLEADLQQARAQNRELHEQHALLQAQNRAVQEEAAAQSDHKAQLEADLQQARAQNRELHEQHALLQAQNRAVQEEAAAQGDHKAQLEADLQQARAQNRELHEQRALLQAQNRAVQEEAEALNKRKSRLEGDLQLVRKETNQLHQKGEVMHAQSLKMQQKLETLEQVKARLEQRLEQLNQGIESYQVQMKDLRSEQFGLKRKVADKESGLQQAGAMLRDLETHAAHLTEELDQAKVRYGKKQQQLEGLEQRLQQFLSSRSYRLTAPLRKMRALISGGQI
ncbi:MAG: hypothetical protein COC12_00235 [Rhodobacteraceae bacterium]|nr:MAG: hypothetical protein COC12_00235 [Paracoccaceae bacterium]